MFRLTHNPNDGFDLLRNTDGLLGIGGVQGVPGRRHLRNENKHHRRGHGRQGLQGFRTDQRVTRDNVGPRGNVVQRVTQLMLHRLTNVCQFTVFPEQTSEPRLGVTEILDKRGIKVFNHIRVQFDASDVRTEGFDERFDVCGRTTVDGDTDFGGRLDVVA